MRTQESCVRNALESENITKIGRDILFRGVREMLETLREKGYPFFIASTGSTHHVSNTLKAAGITEWFTGIHCNEPQKKDMVRRIINGANPAEWAMLGDMFKDSEAARANGIFAIGAGYGYLHKKNHALFDAVIQQPHHIFHYLEGHDEK